MTKSLLVILIMVELSFPCEKKILARWKQKTTFALMRFVTKIDWLFQSKFQTKKLKTRWICCLQFIKKIYIMYMNDFHRYMFHKAKNKNKKYFCNRCLQYFSSRKMLTENKEVCLSIYGEHL